MEDYMQRNKFRCYRTHRANGSIDSIKEKIFKLFFTTKPTGDRTGLGLSMSYDIITKGHGGEIDVESVTNETKFVIKLPFNN